MQYDDSVVQPTAGQSERYAQHDSRDHHAVRASYEKQNNSDKFCGGRTRGAETGTPAPVEAA